LSGISSRRSVQSASKKQTGEESEIRGLKEMEKNK
jgi:hypothetical protein